MPRTRRRTTPSISPLTANTESGDAGVRIEIFLFATTAVCSLWIRFGGANVLAKRIVCTWLLSPISRIGVDSSLSPVNSSTLVLDTGMVAGDELPCSCSCQHWTSWQSVSCAHGFCANYVAEYKPLKVDPESMQNQILESFFLVSLKIQMWNIVLNVCATHLTVMLGFLYGIRYLSISYYDVA